MRDERCVTNENTSVTNENLRNRASRTSLNGPDRINTFWSCPLFRRFASDTASSTCDATNSLSNAHRCFPDHGRVSPGITRPPPPALPGRIQEVALAGRFALRKQPVAVSRIVVGRFFSSIGSGATRSRCAPGVSSRRTGAVCGRDAAAPAPTVLPLLPGRIRTARAPRCVLVLCWLELGVYSTLSYSVSSFLAASLSCAFVTCSCCCERTSPPPPPGAGMTAVRPCVTWRAHTASACRFGSINLMHRFDVTRGV